MNWLRKFVGVQESQVLLLIQTSCVCGRFLGGCSILAWVFHAWSVQSHLGNNLNSRFQGGVFCLIPKLPRNLEIIPKTSTFVWMVVFMKQQFLQQLFFAKPAILRILSFTSHIYYGKLFDELSRLSQVRLGSIVAMVSGSLFT